MATVKWNDDVRLIISDVDETIAGVYMDAEPGMIAELERLLGEGRVMFMITGSGIDSVKKRITDKISRHLRKRILIAHCSGAVVQGFDSEGKLLEPYYDMYETVFSEQQKRVWREVIQQLVSEFRLKTYPTMPKQVFREKSGGNPLSIILDDRGPQITFELINTTELSQKQAQELGFDVPMTHGQFDLRVTIARRAGQLFDENNIPVTPTLPGYFAIDFVIGGVSKTAAVSHVIGNEHILSRLGISKKIMKDPKHLEVWGDKFSVTRSGGDIRISEALSRDVRSINFRGENPDEFPEGYNIVAWDGKEHLHHGLLEFLKSR